MKVTLTIDGRTLSVDVDLPADQAADLGQLMATAGPDVIEKIAAAAAAQLAEEVAGRATELEPERVRVTAPIAGAIARVLVNEGDHVEAGQVVTVLEAVKMETDITAPTAGRVLRVLVSPRDSVQGGAALIELGSDPSAD